MLSDLMNRTINAELREGEHTAILTDWKYHPHPTEPQFDYITAAFIVDGEIAYKRNLFEKDVSIMLSHIRRQLERQHESILPTRFLDELKANAVQFKLWVAYPVVTTTKGLRRVQNLYFMEPFESTGNGTPDEVPPNVT